MNKQIKVIQSDSFVDYEKSVNNLLSEGWSILNSSVSNRLDTGMYGNRSFFTCVMYFEPNNEVKVKDETKEEILEGLRKCILWAESVVSTALVNREDKDKINWTYLNTARDVYKKYKG